MKRISLIGLSFIMVCAVTAVAAASAVANPEFHAAIYPAEWKGTATNVHAFSGAGVVIACKKASFNTGEEKAVNPTTNSATLTVHPKYEECQGSLTVGISAVEARTTGCNYRLHAAAPGKPEGSLDIVCEPGHRIEFTPLGLPGCTITVYPQQLKTLEYKNEPKAGTAEQEVTTAIELAHIKSKATSSCSLTVGTLEFEGEYRQGKLATIGGVGTAQIEPEGHPADVVFQGFAEATKTQEAVEVGNFTSAAPTVTNVEPHSGPAAGGTSVTVTGTNFTGGSVVKFGSTTATSVTVNSETSITAVSPAGTGTVDVTVTTPGGTSATSEADRFTYGPTVTKVEPNHGSPSGGSTVTITGAGFTGATAVKFGATNAASFTVNSATSITAVSPKARGSKTVDVTVTTPAGTSPTIAADQFTYSNK